MLKNINSFLISTVFVSLPVFFGQISRVFASSPETTDALNGLNAAATQVNAYKTQTSGTYDSNFLTGQVGKLIGSLLAFIGILFFGIIIQAGITWMTAAGNTTKIEGAKDRMINATIGLILVLAAYSITSYVGNAISAIK
jgi:hypothetical protein